MFRSALQRLRSKLGWSRRCARSPIVQNRHQLFPHLGVLEPHQRKRLEEIVGLPVQHVEYYEQALVHRSAVTRVSARGGRSNERLEFLGDALLGFLAAEYLFARYPEFPEGELTKNRTWLVNRRTLTVCARRLGIGAVLLMSPSAAQALQHGNDAFLADALEALIAAVYLDHGLDAVREFVLQRLLPIMEQEQLLQDTNYKSLLLEYVQAQGWSAPVYRVLEEHGPDHAKEFVVGVYAQQRCLGVGRGRSKREAEQDAARDALEKLKEQPTEVNANGTAHL